MKRILTGYDAADPLAAGVVSPPAPASPEHGRAAAETIAKRNRRRQQKKRILQRARYRPAPA